MKTSVVYFLIKGRKNEDDINSVEYVAMELSKHLETDLITIERKDAYPERHDEFLKVTREDKIHNKRPEIMVTKTDFDETETVFFVYPNWWGTMPMPLFTFLEKMDLSRIKLIPVCIHEGDGFGQSVHHIKAVSNASVVDTGYTIPNYKVMDSKNEIEEWAKDIALKIKN